MQLDILPNEETLAAAIEHKQTTIPVQNQKEITTLLLDSVKNDQPLSDNILKCNSVIKKKRQKEGTKDSNIL